MRGNGGQVKWAEIGPRADPTALGRELLAFEFVLEDHVTIEVWLVDY